MSRGYLVGMMVAALLVVALPVLAQTSEDYGARGEQMMDWMMGSSAHGKFDASLEQEKGSQFVNDIHQTLGRMGSRSLSGNFGTTGMMGMMGAAGMMGGTSLMGANYGTTSLFGWLWVLVWTVNSILLGILMWVLIKKYSGKK